MMQLYIFKEGTENRNSKLFSFHLLKCLNIMMCLWAHKVALDDRNLLKTWILRSLHSSCYLICSENINISARKTFHFISMGNFPAQLHPRVIFENIRHWWRKLLNLRIFRKLRLHSLWESTLHAQRKPWGDKIGIGKFPVWLFTSNFILSMANHRWLTSP